MAVFIVIWLICGAVAAVIASAKGGSGGLGFVAGFLLGPFGIIMALFMGSEQGREAKALEGGGSKKCPMCAELVKADALVCRHCGHSFAAVEPVSDGDALAPQPVD